MVPQRTGRYNTSMTNTLNEIAKRMVAPGKGIIAADESNASCKKRFEAVGIPDSEENHRLYRQLLLEAPGIEEYVSGVILYDETIRQKDDAGVPFPESLAKRGILPGIKVDKGTVDLALHPEEKITEGLDGLRQRLAEYAHMGAKFAKWRAVITIGEHIPSESCISANAHTLARYAALCQEAGIVPMVEPEVLLDGDHTIERCYEVVETVLEELFEELQHQGVALDGVILKTSMVLAGKGASKQSTPQEVADATVRVLTAVVPKEIPGVVFLSGGQGDEQATSNLNEMNKLEKHPWPLTFSYSRAIQHPALQIWAADTKNNVAKAREALLFRCKMDSLASKGEYKEEMEQGRPY